MFAMPKLYRRPRRRRLFCPQCAQFLVVHERSTLPIMPTRTPSVRLVLAVALACVLACDGAGDARAQDSSSASATMPAAPPQSAAASDLESAAEDDPLQVFRAPLLREGSSLVEAVATLKRDPDQDWWTLTVQPQDSAEPAYELAVLPCTRLAEMERILEAMRNEVTFQVTGRVYVYRDGNYLLPSHAAVVSAAAPSSATAPSPPITAAPTGTDRSAEGDAATRPAAGGRDSAESIMSELEQQAGPIARSSATAARSPRNGLSAADGVGANGSADPASASAAHAAASLQENAAVVNRRGKITRDRSGGWLLVLDADASGLADPPLKLLPCMLLESIEDYARRMGNNSPIVITGQVFLYSGQNYLLPTVYRIPRESSRLTP